MSKQNSIHDTVISSKDFIVHVTSNGKEFCFCSYLTWYKTFYRSIHSLALLFTDAELAKNVGQNLLRNVFSTYLAKGHCRFPQINRPEVKRNFLFY